MATAVAAPVAAAIPATIPITAAVAAAFAAASATAGRCSAAAGSRGAATACRSGTALRPVVIARVLDHDSGRAAAARPAQPGRPPAAARHRRRSHRDAPRRGPAGGWRGLGAPQLQGRRRHRIDRRRGLDETIAGARIA